MKVLILGAHSDDSVLGAGGTIAKCVEEGDEILNVVYSAGEKSPPWALNRKKLVIQRKKEALKADELLGVTNSKFLAYPDAMLSKHQKSLDKLTLKIFKEFKPDKVFVHHKRDLHPDHHAVWKACLNARERIDWKPEVYGFEVNSWFSPFVRRAQIVADITSQYDKKMQAVKAFKSQKYLIFLLQPLLTLRAFHYSSIYGFKYAENFYKY